MRADYPLKGDHKVDEDEDEGDEELPRLVSCFLVPLM
jgi:hypothetical protein